MCPCGNISPIPLPTPSPCSTVRHRYCRSTVGEGVYIVLTDSLFLTHSLVQQLSVLLNPHCRAQPLLQRSGWPFCFRFAVTVMSSSPEAEKLEQSLLNNCAHAEYMGRRPSSSGRDTKRISMCNPEPLYTLPLPLR